MSITASERLRKDLNEKIVEKKFYIACEEDDSNLVKEFLGEKSINPCDMGYKLLRYAIGKKCVKIVDTILESEFFNNFRISGNKLDSFLNDKLILRRASLHLILPCFKVKILKVAEKI